jgi:hypothetical protein
MCYTRNVSIRFDGKLHGADPNIAAKVVETRDDARDDHQYNCHATE